MFKPRILTSRPIRTKLSVLLLVIFLPTFGIILNRGMEQRSREIKDAQDHALMLVQSLAAQQEQIAVATKQMLSTLAMLPEVRRLDGEACSELFRALNDRNQYYSTIAAATPDGNLFAASAPFQPNSINLSGRKHLRDVMQTLDFSAGEYIVGKLSKLALFNYTYPVLDSAGTLIAILIAGFDLSDYDHRIKMEDVPRGYEFTITDHAGVRLYCLPENEAAALGKPIPGRSFQVISGRADSGIFRYVGDDGSDRICAFKQLRLSNGLPPYLYIMVALPEAAILNKANSEMLGNLLILGIIAAIAMLMAWVFGNTALVRPIRHLVAVTQRFGSGDLSTRTDLKHTPDELGRLAKAFDDMASLLEARSAESELAGKELQKARDDLEIKVAERTRDLAQANEILRQEINERRQIEDRLRESEKRFRAIGDSAQDAIIVIDDRGRVAFWNPAAEKIFGYGASEVLGQDIHSMFAPPRYLDAYFAAIAEFGQTGRGLAVGHTQELFALRKSGEEFPIELSLSAFPMDGHWHAAGIVRDITERKRAEAALRESEERHRQITENIREVFWIADPDLTRMIYVSPAYEEVWGRSCAGLYADPRSWLNDIHPDDRRRVNEAILTRDTAGHSVEYRIVRPDGSIGWILDRGFPIRDETGEIYRIAGIAEDITERKLVEGALRQSEEEKSAILNSLKSIFIEYIDSQMRIIWTNTTRGRAVGQPLANLIGKHCYEVIRGLDEPCDGCTAVKALSTGKTEEGEFNTPDGRTLLFCSNPVMHNQEVTGAVHVAVDISERKRSEKRLLKLNRELRAIIECNHALIRSTDERTLLADICRIICEVGGYRMAWVGMAGHEDEENVKPVAWSGVEDGHLDGICIARNDMERWRGPSGTALRTGEISCFQEFAKDPHLAPWLQNALADGRLCSISIPLSDTEGNVFGSWNIYSTTPGAFTEDEIRLLEELAAHLAFGINSLRSEAGRKQTGEAIQAMVEGMVGGLDKDFYDSVVSRVCGWLGCECALIGEISGSASLNVLSIQIDGHIEHDCSRRLEGTPYGNTASTGYCLFPEAVCDLFPEDVELAKMGAVGYIGAPIRDKNGDVTGVLCAISRHPLKLPERSRDVLNILAARISAEIARKRMEEAKEKVELHLRQTQKMEAIGTLAGGIAHDFNNILGIIVGYSEIAGARADDPAEVRECVGEVLKGADRARDLVQQILTFSRGGAQGKKPVQVGLIVKEALKMLRASLPSTIEIKQNIASKAAVIADPTQLHQVLMNLCTNSAHAMQGDLGVLHVTLSDVHFAPEDIPSHLELQPGPHVRLAVKDTGHGIDPSILDRIFDPFFTTKAQGVGTGLGLSVVHGIVKSHGGAITVESPPGRGTTVHVFFPAIGAAPEQSPVETVALPHGTERILVVDDEPALAAVLKEMLESLGYQVESRTSAIDALEAVRSQSDERPFNLVITDMTMPHLTGADLAGELFNLQPDLAILLCTGFSEDMDAERAKSLGIHGFLAKPVVYKELAEMVRKVLDENKT